MGAHAVGTWDVKAADAVLTRAKTGATVDRARSDRAARSSVLQLVGFGVEIGRDLGKPARNLARSRRSMFSREPAEASGSLTKVRGFVDFSHAPNNVRNAG
jgi:hypothetical protein